MAFPVLLPLPLSHVVLAVTLALTGAKEGEAERLAPVAMAIAQEAEAAPLWPGDDGPRRTAMLLVAIANHESSFRESVRTCHRKGDGGRSVGLTQLQRGFAWQGHSEAEICGSDALQARLALGVLHRHVARGVRDTRALLRAYASGSAGTSSRAADELATLFTRAKRLATPE